MTNKTGSKKVTFERLFSAVVGASPANTFAQTESLRLDDGFSAEICYAVIRSPLDAAGAGEAIEFIEPYIDGRPYDGGNQIQIRGDLDSSQNPPIETFEGDQVLGSEGTGVRRSKTIYGIGLPDLATKPMSPVNGLGNAILQNTTVKVKPGGKIAAQYKIGNTATTDDTVIEFWGYKYATEEILQQYMARIYGQAHQIAMFDKITARSFNLTYAAIPALIANWGKLIGGQDQDGKSGSEIIVKKLIRWARNGKATSTNKRYDLKTENIQVKNDYNQMKFDLKTNELIVFQKVGVLAGENHLETYIKVNDQDVLKVPTSSNYNPLTFGRNTPIGAAVEMFNHKFRPMPGINPVFASGETAKVQILDDGTPIPDGTDFGNGTLVCIEALQITTDLLINQ